MNVLKQFLTDNMDSLRHALVGKEIVCRDYKGKIVAIECNEIHILWSHTPDLPMPYDLCVISDLSFA